MLVRSKSGWGIRLDKQLWGPFVLVVGIILFLNALRQPLPLSALHWAGMVLAAMLFVAGLSMMLIQLSPAVVLDPPIDAQGVLGIEQTILQLAKNYELLRRQTSQAFVISACLLTVGVIAILAASLGSIFGFAEKPNILASVAGTISSAISGVGMYLYNSNSTKLRETTNQLEHRLRILTAYRLVETLPAAQKAEATMRLIDSLASLENVGSCQGVTKPQDKPGLPQSVSCSDGSAQ